MSDYVKPIESARASYIPALQERINHVNIDASLPEWKDYTALNISAYTKEWMTSYFESKEWRNRDKRITESLLDLAFSSLSEHIYDQYRKTPKTWSKKAVNGVMVGDFVSHVAFTDEEYTLIVPAISGLLQYVAKMGWLNEKRSETFQRYLAASESDMIRLSKDVNNFSPSKMMVLEMAKQNIDLQNPDDVQKFMDDLNQHGGYDSLYDNQANDSQSDGISSADYKNLIHDPKQLKEIAELYEPDPEQSYLDDEHMEQRGTAHWSPKQATHVHRQGVELGSALMLNRGAYEIPASWGNDEIIDQTTIMVDQIYETFLTPPEKWAVKDFRYLGQRLREDTGKAPTTKMQRIISSSLTLLGEMGTLSPSKVSQLQHALTPAPAISRKTNIISMTEKLSEKKRRKLLRKKRR